MESGEEVAGGILLSVAPKLKVFAPIGQGCADYREPLSNCYGPNDGQQTVQAIQALLAMRKADDVLLWMHSPFVPEALDDLNYRWLVYDCTDDFTSFNWLGPEIAAAVRETDRRILQRADLVLAVSDQLTEAKRAHARTVVRLPNGCDYEHFSRAMDASISVPTDIAQIGSPILGYFGRAGIQRKIDYPLLLLLATRHPDWNIVLVGPVKPWQPELQLPNIHFTGQRAYEELPAYSARFDVCIVPHQVNEFSRSMNPIKLFEYLATGRPVVSTAVSGASELAPAITVEATWFGFEQAVKNALSCDTPDAKRERLRLAQSATWQKRCEQLLCCLRECRIGPPAAVPLECRHQSSRPARDSKVTKSRNRARTGSIDRKGE
jgi:glycosyltransferase involved in cell wall biosynthesis